MSEADRVRARHHLGYPLVTTLASFAGGAPRLMETLFLVNDQLGRYPDGPAMEMVISLLDRLDCTEREMIASQKRFKAKRLGGMELNPEEMKMRRQEYYDEVTDLATALAVPVYQYAQKFKGMGGGINGRVR